MTSTLCNLYGQLVFISVYNWFRVVGSLVADIVMQSVKQEGKELFNEIISILFIKHPDEQVGPN